MLHKGRRSRGVLVVPDKPHSKSLNNCNWRSQGPGNITS
ncbi:hypothetical protein SAMN05216212_3035 [Microbulbifer yueqingensis]|uniref:Uncharacterized protein n=1 Tax=Microbulbifer yueqingensis TaxID=658219 RepID=A0A1G9E693_9GAMM|nr:hypothetical protein SAMN05216212_3035 [Microbulbifer yueqingensis]